MTPQEKDAQARNRFFVMQSARLGGAMMVMFGIVITAGNMQPIPVYAGYAIVVIGLLCLALVPRSLARKWRTPPEA